MSAFLAHADTPRAARECCSARAGQLRSALIGWRRGAFSFLLNPKHTRFAFVQSIPSQRDRFHIFEYVIIADF